MAVDHIKRTERVMQLFLFLVRAGEPRSRREIARDSGLYDENRSPSAAKQFSRDLSDLRRCGFTVNETIAADGGTRYRVSDSGRTLPSVADLTRVEQVALRLASQVVDTGEQWDVTGVAKLAAGTRSTTGPAPRAMVSMGELEPAAAEALAKHLRLRFTYHGKRRDVEPVGLVHRAERLYLVALDGGRSTTYRVDKMEGNVTLGEPFELGPQHAIDLERQVPTHAWQMPFGEPREVTVTVDASHAAQAARRQEGHANEMSQSVDGSLTVRFDVRNPAGLRLWLIELGSHAVLDAPADLVREHRAWLARFVPGWVEGSAAGTALAATPPTAAGIPAGESAVDAETMDPRSGSAALDSKAPAEQGDGLAEALARTSLSSSEQLRLLLTIIPWAVGTGQERVTLAELSAEFNVSVDDLWLLLSKAMAWEIRDPRSQGFAELGFTVMCDEAYDTDTQSLNDAEYREFWNELNRPGPGDGTAWYLSFDPTPALGSPLPLTGIEAVHLLAVGRKAMQLPGIDDTGALATAVRKLEDALAETFPFILDTEVTPWLNELNEAIAGQQTLAVSYYEASSDSEVELTVEPLQLVERYGHWYVVVRDVGGGGGVRPLRLTRVEELAPTGATFSEPGSPGDVDEAFNDFRDGQPVVLRYPEQHAWQVEKYPADSTKVADGWVQATYLMRSPALYAELMLLLGDPDAVAEPLPQEYEEAPEELASSMLARYPHE